MDDKNKIDESEEIQEETDENETINKASDLEQEKRVKNKFDVKGNTAQQQIFIQNLNWSSQYQEQCAEKSDLKKTAKQYDLRNANECSEFVETYKNSEYLAAAIVLSTFEATALTDLPNLQEKLLEYLPAVEVVEESESGKRASFIDPYISINTIMAVIGGKRYIAEDGQICVGLGEDSRKALFHILEQFPLLRNAIVSWMVNVNDTYKYQTFFAAYQMTTAFSRIASFDMADAKKRIFLRLYANQKNAGLLGNLICKLYKDSETKEDAESILLQWVHSDSVWLWKPACLAYSILKEENVKIPFEPDLRRLLSEKLMRFNSYDWSYICFLSMQSKDIRSMLANVFSDVYENLKTREEKDLLTQKYINLVRRGYYRVDRSQMELPLVACDTKEQQECLTCIVSRAMSTFRLRRQLYVILEVYLKEISAYHFSDNMVNHVAAYFYNMASGDAAYAQDTLFFLSRCGGAVAQQIYMKLQNTYKREGLC